jgi:type VI secretion system protein ImpM
MPGEAVRVAGFFGKLPTTGDFVGRGLPAAFVRTWDRWVARHLAGPMAVDEADDLPALRFLLAAGPGPMAGVVIPSADRAGRRFPLTIATVPPPGAGLHLAADPWFDAAEEVARIAASGDLDPDELARRITDLDDLRAEVGPPTSGLVTDLALWTAAEPVPLPVAPDAPGAALERLVRPRRGGG